MANNKILGGSPLGLIGVKSYFGDDKLSTFNAGKTRNVNVPEYNNRTSKAGMLYGNSLFSGYRVVRAWPDINGSDTKGTNDVQYGEKKDNSKRKVLHNNDVYDTSILNIIEKLSPTKASLRPADFAYLKNVGVYPNNRLMIARRFASPSDDNIMINKGPDELSSLATLISWKPEGEDFLEISFGEEWQDSEADFKSILTQLGEDIGIGNLGGIGGAAGNVLPLPGFTEIFQRNFLFNLGIIDSTSKDSIPAGNPNLIKQAKRRKLIGYSEAGSGLKCSVNIKMTCEYELKYISGIDPTVVWMDLLGMIARFGTSNSETYGLGKKFSENAIRWANNPNDLVREAVAAISNAIDGVKKEIDAAINKAYESAKKAADEASSVKTKKEPTAQEIAAANKAEQERGINLIVDAVKKAVKDVGAALLQKYRVKIIGVVNALSGLPSTPWHITVGNPLRPTFCSGDMLVDNVTLKLGPNLAFNDLPSSITVEFNLVNARPWGLQEIMAKFNSGYLRTVDVQKTFYETQKVVQNNIPANEPVGILPLNTFTIEGTGSAGTSGTSGTSGAGGNNSGNNNTNPVSGTSGKVGTSGTSGTSVSPPANPNDSTKAQDNKLPPGPDIRKDANGNTYAGGESRNMSNTTPTAADISKMSPADRTAYLASLTPQERQRLEDSLA